VQHEREIGHAAGHALGHDGDKRLRVIKQGLDPFRHVQIEHLVRHAARLVVIGLAAQPFQYGLGECAVAPGWR